MKKVLFLMLVGLGCVYQLEAAEPPQDVSRQTAWGLYVDAREAYEMKTGAAGERVLLIDVRDPIEVMFTGFSDTVDINIPYMLSNREKWNEKKSVFAMEVNPHFADEVEKALVARNLPKETPIVLMCRSGGERGAPSARALEGKGYTRVYVVTDGFEGEIQQEGERENWRLVNGWKNSGLPWSYKLNKDKLYPH